MHWSEVVARPSLKVLRQFAGLCLVVFGIMAAVGVWRGQGLTISLSIALAGLVVGVIGLVQPAAIRWIYTGWMIAVFPIGWTISRLMLAGMFYLIFTPVALVFRMIRRDPLRLGPGDARSYWLPKSSATSADQYFRQF